MKTYKVTESYTTTRVMRVIAPDPEAAKAWDVHPKALVIDYGTYKQTNITITSEEENAHTS